MIQYAPYILAAAGCALLINAAVVRVNGAWPFFTYKVATPFVGAASIWMSAIMLVGGA
jgi:hypothetical protein